jgi:hypothetical protein
MKRMNVLSVAAMSLIGLNVVAVLPTMLAQAQEKPATQPAMPEDHEHAKFDLGTQKIGGFDLQVGQVAEAKPGEEAIFIIAVKGTGKPKAIRAWIGIESGQGSIRTAAEEEKPGEWHAHHTVSKPIPNNSKLWIELENAAAKPKASFEFKK